METLRSIIKNFYVELKINWGIFIEVHAINSFTVYRFLTNKTKIYDKAVVPLVRM